MSQPEWPPIPYVRLAKNMYLTENHKHVGPDGRVYLPLLHEWKASEDNLIELVVAMSSVFSNVPPVFTTETPPSPPSSPPPRRSSFPTTNHDNHSNDFHSESSRVEDVEAIEVAEAARAAEEEERRITAFDKNSRSSRNQVSAPSTIESLCAR